MTKAEEGGRGGHANADDCWRGGEGGLKTPDIGWHNMWTAPHILPLTGLAKKERELVLVREGGNWAGRYTAIGNKWSWGRQVLSSYYQLTTND